MVLATLAAISKNPNSSLSLQIEAKIENDIINSGRGGDLTQIFETLQQQKKSTEVYCPFCSHQDQPLSPGNISRFSTSICAIQNNLNKIFLDSPPVEVLRDLFACMKTTKMPHLRQLSLIRIQETLEGPLLEDTNIEHSDGCYCVLPEPLRFTHGAL